MKKIVLLIVGILFCNVFLLYSKDQNTKLICASFADCITKADETDIHRKKIMFFDEAIQNYPPKDKEALRIEVLLKRANSIIKEASGDTGYRGDVVLKVTHKPEYVKSQFSKAKEDLEQVELKKNLLSEENLRLFLELKSEVQKAE